MCFDGALMYALITAHSPTKTEPLGTGTRTALLQVRRKVLSEIPPEYSAPAFVRLINYQNAYKVNFV